MPISNQFGVEPEEIPGDRIGFADSDETRQYILQGWCLLKGEVCRRDHAEAAACFRLAATLGDAEGQYLLGGLYETGTGVPQDSTLAAFWYVQAAEQNHIDAQCLLASCYFRGQGADRNLDKSEFWTRKAAALGSAESQSNLQILCGLREGTTLQPTDREQRLMTQFGFDTVECLIFWLNLPIHPVSQLRLIPAG
jgi:TPR repeat protein